MPMQRVMECDICGAKSTEEDFGDGFNGWGQLMGIVLDDVQNPFLCPEHLKQTAEFIDGVKHAVD